MKRLLETLFKTYYRDVVNYLYSLSRDIALSEDMAMDVFVEVVKSVHKFRGESDIKTWLFSIARHKWFNYLRKKNRTPATEALSEFLPSEESPLEESVYEKALTERIYSLIDEEPQRTKDIILSRLEGLSFYEISKQHDISESSARVIFFRAKTKIKEKLIKEGYENE
ncbi:MAG: sigma-70 family RNA polymerase sigma factor [Eubacteriaceae bacterium]|nr:sigma-70 family RNA polymerase sigma factor [Eubacteriaceae bacterium]